MKKIAPILLTMVILGCTQQTTDRVSSGNGVVIEGFSSDLSSVFPNDRFTISLTYINNGEAIATNVFANLQAVSSLNVDSTNKNSYTTSGLEPEDYDLFEWNVVVPENAIEGEVYHPKALFCYSYKTDAYTDLFLADRTWSGELPLLNNFYSSGPVSITFEKTVPIRGERTSSFRALVSLIAPGFIGDDTGSIDSYGTRNYLEQLYLRIPRSAGLIGVDEIDFDCTLQGEEHICKAKDTALRMINDKASARLYLNIDPVGAGYGEGVSYEQVVRVYANATYKHCMDTDTVSTVSVVVRGY